jgi:esterase/lipase
MVEQNAKTIDLKADSKQAFFLIHGYTGSPTDFASLPQQLHKNFGANVKVPLLVGHGTKISDLDKLGYADFMAQIETELQVELATGKQIILGGVSMGALFALILAAKYPVLGVFNVCPPYFMKPPFSIKGASYLGLFNKYWKKRRDEHELEKRSGTFSYNYMHINGLQIAKEAKKVLKLNFKKINCPLLTIHSYTDPIGHYKSLAKIQNSVRSTIKAGKIMNTEIHNVFFSMNNNETHQTIINFIKQHNLFSPTKQQTVAAIIPAFNEGTRIKKVLETITQTKIIDEIIVIDDGSTDNTQAIVKLFPQVRYLKNEYNLGKAESMDKGVQSTKADIIFFCDADLIDFTPEIATQIIQPVKAGSTNMFIGLRGNFMQSSVRLFALNSGERTLHRIVWDTLPQSFKHKYRIEAGLNYHVQKHFGGYDYQTFNYSQPIKEQKYNFLRGTSLRWKMNLSVLFAYCKIIFSKE